MHDGTTNPPGIAPATDALYLDFDGTLVEIAPRPDAVRVPEPLPALLERLLHDTCGAVALVSGRTLADLEHFLPDFSGALIGSHGAEMRGAEGLPPPEGLGDLQDEVRGIAADSRLLAEIKARGAALHFRECPDLEDAARAAAEDLAARYPAFALQPAKMAFELKPKGATKAAALERLSAEAPFAGRRPVYLGDDATDEAAFEWVLGRDGLAVKIGEGETLAPYRLSDPSAVLHWLAEATERSERECRA